MNAATAHTSVNAIDPWICTSLFGLNTVPDWCRVCHHVTERCTIGTSANAMIAAIAHRLPRSSAVDAVRRSARYPRYRKKRIAVLVSRASHTQ